MDSTNQEWILSNGLNVVGSDGEKFGEVEDSLGEYFIAKKGWLFPTEFYIPATAITSVDDQAVYLNVTKDEAMNQGWDQAPVTDTIVSDATYDETTSTGADTYGNAGFSDQLATPIAANQATEYVNDADTISVPLTEEELTATTREVDRGAVRIEKDVVAEERSIDVPVTEEEVHVTRRIVDREVSPGETLFEEGTIEVPIRGEEVDVEKRARVTEELEISKSAVEHTEHVTDTVRREEARIVDDSDVVADDERPIR